MIHADMLAEAEQHRRVRIDKQVAKARKGMSEAVEDIVLATRRYQRWQKKESYYLRERIITIAQKRQGRAQRRLAKRIRKIVL